MFATIINACAVILGSLMGLLFRGRVHKKYQDIIMSGAGVITLIIGIVMALRTERVLYLALSLIVGGLAGSAIGIERHVLALGGRLKALVPSKSSGGDFARGFMEASVLFCAGSMAIIGSIQAATGDWIVLLTKSVLDGFMALIMASALGVGVMFSALSVLVYQGIITLVAGISGGVMDPLVLSSISGCGGALVIMIGLGLLDLRKIPTADFLPSLVLVAGCAMLDPWIPALMKG